MSKRLKTVIISAVCIVVAAAIIVGVFWFLGKNRDPINVYAVVDMNGYYGSQMESGGTVTTDKLQSVYASDTQNITEIFVSEGQNVKAGDPLVSYDTTLTDIQLERRKIAVKQAELELQNQKKWLDEINSMKPYVPPAVPDVPPEPEIPEEEKPIEVFPHLMSGNGTEETPYYYLCDEGMVFEDEFMLTVLAGKDMAWAVFEIRENNMLSGEVLSTWGMKIEKGILSEVSWSVFVPTAQPDENEPEIEVPPIVDDSSGYTYAEIAAMRKEAQAKIKELDIALRMQEIELKRMESEAAGNTVFADVDGKVVSVMDAEEAMLTGSPVLTVSGGGCYYINATVGEFDREELKIGDAVRVMAWESGGEYEGTIEEISDTPIISYDYYTTGNTNISYYRALVAVDSSAALREYEYVSVYFDGAGSDGNGDKIILENMFIRSESGKSYVLVQNDENKLEKRYVETGKSYWGQSTEIVAGITIDDCIAFPYGSGVEEGVETRRATMDELYNYGIY